MAPYKFSIKKGIAAFLLFFLFLMLPSTRSFANVNILCIQGVQDNYSSNRPSDLMPKVYSAFSNAKYTEKHTVSYYPLNSSTTKDDFIRQLNSTFSGSTSKDLNIIYYFGEGAIASKKGDKIIQIIAAAFWQYWYRSSNKNGLYLGKEHISYFELAEQLMSYNGNFVLLLDCCGSGGFNKYAFRKSVDKEGDDKRKLNKITCITASKDNQASHGNFTKNFLKKIGYNKYTSMSADIDLNGFVSAKELYQSLCSDSICLKGSNNPNLLSFAYTEITTDTSGKTYSQKDSLTMKASIKQNGSGICKVKWKASGDAATINSKGKVTFKKTGTVKITSYLTDPMGKTVLRSDDTVTLKVVLAESLYKPFLEKGTTTVKENGSLTSVSLSYYYLLDIDQDGVCELITKPSASGYMKGLAKHYIFTIKKNKVTYVGSMLGPGSSVAYCKKYNALYNSGWTNGIGAAWSHLFRMSNSGMKQYKFIWSGSESYGSSKIIYKTGTSDTTARKVSKSSYNAFWKKYFDQKIVYYSFLSNNASNRYRTFGA